MIELNGHEYKLCVLDTNAVSEMIKRPTVEFRAVVDRFALVGYLPCISPFTVIELRRRRDLYQSFLQYFSVFPCLLVEGYEQLLGDEVEHYPNPSSIDPTLVAPWGIQLPLGMSREEALADLFETPMFRKGEQERQRAKASILKGMVSLVPSYPPGKDGGHAPRMVSQFVNTVSADQIRQRAPRFVRRRMLSPGRIEVDAFPSVKMMTFTVFYKFYPDRRTALESDVFDIIMSAAIPHVDAVLTERHQAEVLRKTKQQDPFVEHVEVFTLADLRSGQAADG